jgi:hypothetical protein
MLWASSSVIATCRAPAGTFTCGRGWVHGYRDDAVATACNNRIASSACFCPRRRLLPISDSYNSARLAIRPSCSLTCSLLPPRRVPASKPKPRLSQAVDRTCSHIGTRRASLTLRSTFTAPRIRVYPASQIIALLCAHTSTRFVGL